MDIIQYPQKNFNKKIADKILALEHIALPQDTEDEVFPTVPNTYLTSFILTENNTAICHVGNPSYITKEKNIWPMD